MKFPEFLLLLKNKTKKKTINEIETQLELLPHTDVIVLNLSVLGAKNTKTRIQMSHEDGCELE